MSNMKKHLDELNEQQYGYYVVTNIRFNDNKEYRVDIPNPFTEYGALAEPFLRTHAFNFVDFKYDFKKASLFVFSSETMAMQNYIPDLIDNNYPERTISQVLACPQSNQLVYISQDNLIDANHDVEQAIFQRLMDILPVNFIIRHYHDEHTDIADE